MPRRILSLFRNLLRKHTVEQALDDELRSSVEILAEEKMKDGLSRAVALRQAMIELGGVEQVKEEVRAIRVGRFLENCTRDLRLALRTLAKAPSFTAVVITLALGIGANTTIFAMLSRFVLHTARVGDPPTLLTLHTTDQNECCNNFSWPLFTDVRDGANSFSGVAGFYELLPASISGSGDPQRLWGQATSTNFFDVAQLGMTLGRGFRSDEQNSPVIVLGHRIWKSRFNSDHDILGKSIALSGHPYTVVGVAPAYFRGIDLILDTQFWVPIGNIDQLLPNTGHFDWRNYHWIAVAARLKPGVSRAEAAAELQFLSQRFTHSHPDTEKNLGFRFEQAGSLPPRDKTVILLFLSTLTLVVFFVLLIACGNVANLFLAQAAGRQREMAVRIVLGATRAQLLRHAVPPRGQRDRPHREHRRRGIPHTRAERSGAHAAGGVRAGASQARGPEPLLHAQRDQQRHRASRRRRLTAQLTAARAVEGADRGVFPGGDAPSQLVDRST